MPYNTIKHGRAEYNSWTQITSGDFANIIQGADAATEADVKNEHFAQIVYDVAGATAGSATNTILSGSLLASNEYSRIIKSNGDDVYIMHAPPGSLSGNPVWRMQKIDVDGSRFWADGNTNFDNAASGYLTANYTL